MAALTLTFTDTTSAPVVGASVMIYAGDNLTLVTAGVTDGSGSVLCTLPLGTYYAEITGARVYGGPARQVVFATDPQTTALTVQTVVSAVAVPVQAILYGNLVAVGGASSQGVRVAVSTGAVTTVTAGNPGVPYTVGAAHRDVFTDQNGYWACPVPPGALTRIEVPSMGIHKYVRIPSDATAVSIDGLPNEMVPTVDP